MKLRKDITEKSDKQLWRDLKYHTSQYASSAKMGSERGMEKHWARAEEVRAELRRRGHEVPDGERLERAESLRETVRVVKELRRDPDAPPKQAHLSPLRGGMFTGRPKCVHCRKAVKFGATHCHHCGQIWSR
jgi:hypothetical protein